MLLRDERGKIRHCHVQDAQTALNEATAEAPILDASWLRQETKMGAWLTLFPSKMNGTELGFQ